MTLKPILDINGNPIDDAPSPKQTSRIYFHD